MTNDMVLVTIGEIMGLVRSVSVAELTEAANTKNLLPAYRRLILELVKFHQMFGDPMAETVAMALTARVASNVAETCAKIVETFRARTEVADAITCAVEELRRYAADLAKGAPV